MKLKTKITANFAICSVLLVLVFATPSTLPATTIYTAILAGANEVPPNASPGSGTSTVTLNGDALTVHEVFSGLSATVTAAHIHCCAPAGTNTGVAITFPSFPAVTSGTYDMTFDLTLDSTYNPAFETVSGGTAAGAEAALIAGLNAGFAYANIHDSTFPGGEIRGQLAAVPEPSTGGLLPLGLIPVVAMVRRRTTRAKAAANRLFP